MIERNVYRSGDDYEICDDNTVTGRLASLKRPAGIVTNTASNQQSMQEQTASTDYTPEGVNTRTTTSSH